MAEKIRDYSRLARDIIIAVGGEKNIVSAARCATRLRLVLKEVPADATARVSSMAGVITVVEKGGQYQIVIGPHVGEVFDVVAKELRLDDKQGEVPEVQQGLMNRIIAAMSAVFAPFVYVLAAAGLIQGLLIVIKLISPGFADTGTHALLNLISWAPFTFMPILIAISVSKHFKCNTYVAVTCCCALVSPSWTALAGRIADGEVIKFLLFPMTRTTYTSTVLPPLFLVLVLAYLEHFLQKRLPEVIRSLVTPFLCIIIMVPATILVLGPVANGLANGLATAYNTVYAAVPILASLIFGGFWQVLVIFGVHWGFNPLTLANFEIYGWDTTQVFKTCAVISQAAACFAVFMKSRNPEFKKVSFSSGLTGVFGITKPAIYGITLRLKKPFICACIASAIGSAVASFFHSAYYVYAGLPSILTVVNAISDTNPTSFIGILAGCATTIVITFVLIQVVGFDDPPVPAPVSTVPTAAPAGIKKNTTIVSPLNGIAKSISEVNDPTFSEGVLGQGIAIIPSEGRLYAPFDGVVGRVVDTKHAVNLINDAGVEMLIHIGLETVSLDGKYYKVKDGDPIKAGDLLIEFDLNAIRKDFDTITPVLVTNADDLTAVEVLKDSGPVKVGEPVLLVRP